MRVQEINLFKLENTNQNKEQKNTKIIKIHKFLSRKWTLKISIQAQQRDPNGNLNQQQNTEVTKLVT